MRTLSALCYGEELLFFYPLKCIVILKCSLFSRKAETVLRSHSLTHSQVKQYANSSQITQTLKTIRLDY